MKTFFTLNRICRGLLLTLLLSSIHTVSQATTAVMLNDEDLIVSSRSIIRGRVVGGEYGYDKNKENIYTYLIISVDEVLKGAVNSNRIVVRQPGGRIGDVMQTVVGAPQFFIGEEVLLFLNTADDGALRIAHLFMGKFSIVKDEATGDRFIKRSTAAVNILDGERSGNRELTDYMELNAYLDKIRLTLKTRAERVREFEILNSGRPMLDAPPEFIPSKGKILPQFSLLGQPEPGRWHGADLGVPVDYRINNANAPVSGGGTSELEAALAAWTNISNASIVLRLTGTSSSCGFSNRDGENTVSFEDCRSEIDDLVNCGGILARAQFVSTSDRRTVNGRSFFRIVDADIVCNNGLRTCNISSSRLAQLLTHEVGHTIGLGHSSEDRNESNSVLKEATMYFLILADNRGGAVRSDDIAGTAFIYPIVNNEPQDFSIRISPDSQTAQPGDTASYTINAVFTGGFSSALNITFSNLPPGASVPTFQGNFPLPFTVATNAATPPGAYTFTVTAMGGGLTRAANAVLIVQEPAGPAINNATFVKPMLLINGSRFGASGIQTLINDTDVSSRIVSRSDTSIALKGNKKKLNLRKGTNRITIVVGGKTSNTFILNL